MTFILFYNSDDNKWFNIFSLKRVGVTSTIVTINVSWHETSHKYGTRILEQDCTKSCGSHEGQ